MPIESNTTGIMLGCLLYSWDGYNGAYCGDIYFGEILLFNAQLSEWDKVWWHQYLAAKWGLKADVDSDLDGRKDKWDFNNFDSSVQDSSTLAPDVYVDSTNSAYEAQSGVCKVGPPPASTLDCNQVSTAGQKSNPFDILSYAIPALIQDGGTLWLMPGTSYPGSYINLIQGKTNVKIRKKQYYRCPDDSHGYGCSPHHINECPIADEPGSECVHTCYYGPGGSWVEDFDHDCELDPTKPSGHPRIGG